VLEFVGLRDREPPREFTEEIHEAYLRVVLNSSSWLTLFQITDVFGWTARFNTPGSVSGSNWSYRLLPTVAELDKDPLLVRQGALFSRLVQDTARRPG
jgi:4-alpha-glucanotransferase